MEKVKITKKMLKLHPADLLVKLGLVNEEKKMLYPHLIFFSKEDYKELGKNLKKYAKKVAPHSSERLLNYSVNVDLLSYGPNESLAEVLKPGWALVDREGMEKEK